MKFVYDLSKVQKLSIRHIFNLMDFIMLSILYHMKIFQTDTFISLETSLCGTYTDYLLLSMISSDSYPI